MKITFDNSKLEKFANNDKQALKKLGKVRSQLFKTRLDDLHAAQTLEDVRYLPGKYHELIGDRKGQWACNLDQPYRLIFKPHENPIPENANGQFVWIEILGVEIVEITNYHKEK